MRLIDVSVLKEWVKNWFAKNRYYHPYAKNNNIPITELYDILEQMPSAQPEQAIKDCRNCKHGKYNDHLETHFCYNPNECTEWNLWEPIAQPEWKKGKWIYNSPVTMKCDQCGLVIKDWDWNRFKYCPNCCSDMRGERE